MDTDELIVRARQNCCRLCLAPDSECVPIFVSYAADKEPISIKIQTCVNIKVTQEDRLSLKICHFCISYLNSWQSFKNRCVASQAKQQYWLEIAAKNASGKSKKSSTTVQNKYALLYNKKSMPSPVKQEPGEELENNEESEKPEEEESMKVDIDPTQFLAKSDEDEGNENHSAIIHNLVTSNCNDDPPILTSLGLTHITSVNPYSFLSTELGQQDTNQVNTALNDDINSKNLKSSNEEMTENLPIKLPKTLSSCSICKLAFSTRANARRHERNIHGKIINSALSIFGGRRTIIKKSQVTPEMMGIYDYTKPEKYRHLLTEQKLLFIRRNGVFLKQYQTLTCNCCSKTHPTYKNFMAHMRKKYPSLGRNLCFKCLKQFQTKAMFVSHLKKKCCINLYKLYMSDNSIPKDGPLTMSPDKMGAKDLLTNKIYECKLCSKTSRRKADFRAHVSEDHSDIQKKDIPAGHCGFCGVEIEDPVERKRHYNNMECIVTLKCVTCEDKFDNHQLFVDHVYEAHLPHHQMVESDGNNEDDADEEDVSSSSNKIEPQIKELITIKKEIQRPIDSRSPQNCKICGQHYNNYNNVLRHMESKHPDQLPETYKCSMCDVGFARMSMLREHMLDKHGKKVPKYIRKDSAITVSATTATMQNLKFECRMCSSNFQTVDKWILHQANTHGHFVCFQCNFQNKNIDEFKKHIEAHSNLMHMKISGDSNMNLGNNNTTMIQSTNEAKTSNRYDYIMKDLLAIRNGIKLQEELNNEDNKVQCPPQKKIKIDTNLKECQICHAVFNSNLGLSNHMRTHNAQQQQQQQQQQQPNQANGARINPKTVENKISKNIHFGVTASDLLRRIRCRLCQKRFSTKKGYRKHMLIDHQVKNVEFIKCTICKADFTHEKGLKLHMMRVHDAIVTNVTTNTDSQLECDQCQTIFKNEEQLNAHKSFSHNQDNESGSVPNDGSTATTLAQTATESNYWFQCRYCPANFDTNKKLAIHTNSHDEFDSNDYSCKDCGNVYSGRKSLWVHRYKKHPLIPDPSLCTLCSKTFFDKNMLEMHIKNYSHANMPNKVEDSHSDYDQNNEVCNMSGEFDDDGDGEDETREFSENIEGNMQTVQQVPEVRCTVCNLKFTDVESFTKHMNMHEMELYTDNPLAAMFDTGPDDPNKFYDSRLGENGEYMCDICPKTFPMLTAFKVHRNWHFRSDGKQVPADPNTTWRGAPRKKKDPATSVKCQYCNSLFISENNLKRHIMELHRRELSNGEAPKIFIEKYLECKKCEMKFRFKGEWIAHKLEHVQNATIDSTFGWGCEICGKIVSRKERLIQHVRAHMKEDDPSQKTDANSNNSRQSNSEGGFESNSQDSNSLCESNDNEKEKSSNSNEREIIAHVTSDGAIMRKCDNENDDDDDDDIDDDDEEDNDSEVNTSTYNSSDEEEHRTDSERSSVESDNDGSKRQPLLYSCDLCHVNFETSKELQCHVTSHFLNGPGSVTLTETEKNEETEETQ